MEAVTALSRERVETLSQALGEPAWLTQARLAAWEAYKDLPFPTPKTEEWKYTDIRNLPFEALPLETPTGRTLSRDALPQAIQARLEQTDAAAIAVFVGPDLAYVELPEELREKGVIVTDLRTALAEHPEKVRPALYRAVPATSATPGAPDKLTALSAAFWTYGIFIYLPKGVTLNAPIGIFKYLETGGTLSVGRTLIVAEETAQGAYLEEYLSPDLDAPAIHVSTSELLLHPGAILRHANVQTWGRGVHHFHRQRALLEKDARLNDLVATFGGTLSRAEVQSELVGPGADSEMLGVYFAHADQHFDHYTLQHHVADHARSDVLYKGAAKDRARTVYSGLIRLEPGAQKTDAYQTNRNLLLSPEARSDSVPQLEIAANDVRCSHGSSTAPVDETQVLYLMSRGLPRALAEQLLVKAFLADVLTRIPLPALRRHIETVIEEKVTL